jgi:hypothetical protein
MKKSLIIAALILFATPALAGQWNWNIFGSNDHHKNRRHSVSTPIERPEPNPPVVHDVPEPGTLILLTLGGIALVIGGAVEGKRSK